MSVGVERELGRIADALEALVKMGERFEAPLVLAAGEKPTEWKPRWEQIYDDKTQAPF